MSGALVLWREGTSRPAHTSTAFARLKSMMPVRSPARRALRAPAEMRHVVVDLGHEHRAQRRERHAADRRIERHVEHLRARCRACRNRRRRAAAARERQAECPGLRYRTPPRGSSTSGRCSNLDRPDHERRAVGAPFQILRAAADARASSRPADRAPAPPRRGRSRGPELQQLHAGLDAVADAHRHCRSCARNSES